LARVESRLGDQNKNLTGEQTNLSHMLERFEAERKAALSPLDSRSVEMYESLRRDRRGLAVTTIGDGSCNACGTTLTPAQQQIARSSGQVTQCPTCGRVLFSE
jgi:hypothetical protein